MIIAGSDSSGGAGIQADLKAVTALGGYAMTAITSLTAQNTLGVYGVYDVSPERVKELKLISNKKIIQSIKVKKEEDIDLYKEYVGIADEFLFDSPGMEKSSNFNWDYLKNIEIKEWFLAGGINIDNFDKAKNIAQKIDISSGLEDNPGKKSVKKISDFLSKLKSL